MAMAVTATATATATACPGDASHRVFITGCRHNFDFTVWFEKSILSTLPAVLAIVCFSLRAHVLSREQRREQRVAAAAPYVQAIKTALYLVLVALHITMLGWASAVISPQKNWYIASDCLAMIAMTFTAVLSFAESRHSLRPPVLAQAYLLLGTITDGIQARTAWMQRRANSELYTPYAAILIAVVIVKAATLGLETFAGSKPAKAKLHESSELSAGLFGIASFAWLNPLLKTGYKKRLLISDLFTLRPSLQTRNLFAAPHQEKRTTSSILGLLVAPLGMRIVITVVPRLFMAALSFAQAFLLKAVLQHLQQPENDLSDRIGYALVASTFLVYAGLAAATSWYWYAHETTLVMGQSILMSALYAQTLQSGLYSSDSGAEGVTLLGTEVDRARLGFKDLHDLWCCPVEAAVAVWLLYRQLGPAAVAPIVLVVLVTACTALLGGLVPERQRSWIRARQERVGLTAETIKDLEPLQTANLINTAEQAIQSKRNIEIIAGRKYRLIQLFIITLAYFPLYLSPVFAFAFTNATMDTATLFQSVAFMMLLSTPLSQLFQTLSPFLAALACLGRILAYLKTTPRVDCRNFCAAQTTPGSDHAVEITGCDFGWISGLPVLRNVKTSMPRSCLTIVAGETGSGKSTFCKALLGEVPFTNGQVNLCGRGADAIGYCDQEPWLLNRTIRENITGFSTFRQELYDEVVRAAMLSEDLLHMTQGDLSEVGSNGANLSGGQRRRIALARALYMQPSMFILDDCLTGLDPETAKSVFDNVLGPRGIIKRRGATAILATSSPQYHEWADCVVTLDTDGTCVTQHINAYQGLDIDRAHGSSTSSSSHDYVKSRSPDPGFDQNTAPTNAKGAESSEDKKSAYFNEEELLLSEASTTSSILTDASSPKVSSRTDNSLQYYQYYLKSTGIIRLLLFVALATTYAAGSTFSTVWLSIWTQSPAFQTSKPFYLGLFGLFKASALILFFLSTAVFLVFVIDASSRAVHNDALYALAKAPIRLLTEMDLGQITALFSQDMNIIDGELPQALMNAVLGALTVVGALLVLAITSPYILASLPILIPVLWIVQTLYLRTARPLRILLLESKEPLYVHFLDTLRGTVSIRALAATTEFMELNSDMIDTAQSAAYLSVMVQRWLGFVLSMIVAVLGTLLVGLAFHFRTDAGISGAALISLLSLGEMLTTVVQFTSRMEIAMGTVQRLREFASAAGWQSHHHAKSNPTIVSHPHLVRPEWPSKGEIVFDHVSVRYGHDDLHTVALRDVSFKIKPAAKVAIVGRSGSGKTTLLRLFLRLLDPEEGSIKIDGISLDLVERTLVRGSFIAVAQNTTFLSQASFRTNLDPENLSSEEDCLRAIGKVGLDSLIQREGGLDALLQGENLSRGEGQLLGLARAILRMQQRKREHDRNLRGENPSGGILLLDEVGSALDDGTHSRMWNLIMQEFSEYTILAVIHRVEDVGIRGLFDRTLVVADGSVNDLTSREGS